MTAETTAPEATAVQFDTKEVVVLAEGLASWQESNVTAFLMSGIATSDDGLTGEPYRAAVAAVSSEDLDLVGIVVRGPRNALDRVVKGARFHD